MVVSRDINLIITQDAAPKNVCGQGTGNKYIISHGLIYNTGFPVTSSKLYIHILKLVLPPCSTDLYMAVPGGICGID